MKNINAPEDVWTAQKYKLKLLFHLKDEDLQYDYGQREVMMTALQQKLGKTREDLNNLLEELSATEDTSPTQ